MFIFDTRIVFLVLLHDALVHFKQHILQLCADAVHRIQVVLEYYPQIPLLVESCHAVDGCVIRNRGLRVVLDKWQRFRDRVHLEIIRNRFLAAVKLRAPLPKCVHNDQVDHGANLFDYLSNLGCVFDGLRTGHELPRPC